MSKIDMSKKFEQEIIAFVKSSINEHGAPLCPFCQKFLKIVQDIECIYWEWDYEEKKFMKHYETECDSEHLYCAHCWTQDDKFNLVLSALEE